MTEITRAWVGRVDGTTPSVMFDTLAEAEAEIARIEKIDPDGVHAGDYYIDAEEETSQSQGWACCTSKIGPPCQHRGGGY